MLKRQNTLLLIGVLLVVIGGTLLFIPFEGKPVWLLGPTFFYLGASLAFVGAAIRFFG